MIEIKSFIPLPNIRQYGEDKGGMETKNSRLEKKNGDWSRGSWGRPLYRY